MCIWNKLQEVEYTIVKSLDTNYIKTNVLGIHCTWSEGPSTKVQGIIIIHGHEGVVEGYKYIKRKLFNFSCFHGQPCILKFKVNSSLFKKLVLQPHYLFHYLRKLFSMGLYHTILLYNTFIQYYYSMLLHNIILQYYYSILLPNSIIIQYYFIISTRYGESLTIEMEESTL